MEQHAFGPLAPVSRLTLGGGGVGMLWGTTTEAECIATIRHAVDAGITLLDMAPRYGDGLAETFVGKAFEGKLPDGVRVTSKCSLGNPAAADVERILRRSIGDSLARMRLSRLDLFFLHTNVVPNGHPMWAHPESSNRMTSYSRFVETVRPLFERFVAEGLIGAWGLTGIGHPDTIIQLLAETPAPAAVQCIANLLDSPGGLKFFDGSAKPREIMAAARANGVGVMGIRAVQGGALTRAIDRVLPADHPETRDHARAKGFRALCAELDADPAVLAHRYALSLDIDTVVLGVKNRAELDACVEAGKAGRLPAALIARIDASLGG